MAMVETRSSRGGEMISDKLVGSTANTVKAMAEAMVEAMAEARVEARAEARGWTLTSVLCAMGTILPSTTVRNTSRPKWQRGLT